MIAKKRRKRKGWIARVVSAKGFKKGALHTMLHVPQGQKIPLSKLRTAAKSKNKLLAKRARFALNATGRK